MFGVHFTIVTDCNSLRTTLDKRDVSPKIARWALFLEQYDYDIVHRNNDRIRHVDALSRVHVYILDEDEREISNVFNNALYVNQLKDDNIQRLKQNVINDGLDGYEIRDGILYKVIGKKSLLYVPSNMEQSVIYKFHNETGHFGIDKVCEMIKRLYWFPQMRIKLSDHIKSCIVCITYNPKRKRYDGKLNNVEKPKIPFEMVHVDHIGPLEMTRTGNKYVFGICDAFTKFLKLYPSKTTNTKEVNKFLKNYIYTYSRPKILVSDRGSCFTSDSFKKMTTDHGITHVLTATACPKANGQIERYNRTLVPLLSKLVEESKQQWDTVLSEAEFFMNNTMNRSIGNIPSVLLFGVVQTRKVQRELTSFLDQLDEECERDLQEIRRRASDNIQALQDYNKRQFDKHCTQNTVYKEGDLVMIRNVKAVGESNKLRPKYKGPYTVKKVLDRNRYVVSDIDGYQVSQIPFEGIFDPLNMRLYQSVRDEDGHDPTGDYATSDSEPEFLGFED